MNSYFDRMQVEQLHWAARNFPKQTSSQMCLGVIEELSELGCASNRDDILDAVGDVMIYIANFCSLHRLRLQDIVDSASPSANGLLKSIGLLAHHQLKGEQNIRGGTAVHIGALQHLLGSIIGNLRREYLQPEGLNLEDVVEKVWSKVRQRDWVANPNTAADVVERASGDIERQ